MSLSGKYNGAGLLANGANTLDKYPFHFPARHHFPDFVLVGVVCAGSTRVGVAHQRVKP